MKLRKKIVSILLIIALVFDICIVSDSGSNDVYASEENEITTRSLTTYDNQEVYDSDLVVEKIENLDEDFIMGVDVSSVIALENAGVKYYDYDGKETDLFEILADSGINYIRVRIWNNPYDANGNAYGGGNNDLAVAEAIGKRATAAGLKLFVDFHYSDFWADPSKQTRPKAWANYSTAQIVAAVETFTTESLQTLYDDGIDIGMVQVGNETTSKFIGASAGSAAFYSYFASGCNAVRAFSDTYNLGIKVALHWTNPNSQNFANVVKNLISNGVDFDVFASSYYPAWHGTIANVQSKLKAVKTTYGKDVMIAETAYPYQYESDLNTYTYGVSVQSQATYLHDLIKAMSDIGAIGVFYWEPAWINTTSSDWNKYGTGWTSSYAKNYDADATSAGACTTTNTALFKKKTTYKFYPLESLNVFKYVYKGTTASLKITDCEIPTVEVEIGKTVTLPSTVEVTYGSGITGSESVAWDEESIKNIDTSKEGEYTVTGKVDGYDETVYCKVVVSDIYIAYAKDAEVSVLLGEKIVYPDSVTVTRSNATTASVPVTWDSDEMSKVSSDCTGQYVVSGTIDGYDAPVYCNVSVYVQGENLVENSSFEDAGGSSGNVRNIPNWTTSSTAGTSADRPIYTESRSSYDGNRRLSIWSGSYDKYTVEAYQEIDISGYGAGVYTVSLYATGNISADSLYIYIKNGDHNSDIIAKSVITQNSATYVNTTFNVNVTNADTITVGIVGENVAKNAWANIDCVEVTSPGEYTLSKAEQLNKLVAEAQENIASGLAISNEELAAAVETAANVISKTDATEAEIEEAFSVLSAALDGTEFAVSVSGNANGTINTDITSAKAGEKVQLDISVASPYELSTLKVTDSNLQEIEVNDDYSFIMPASPVTVNAIFKLQDKYINQSTMYYYYSGKGTPALLFDNQIEGKTYDFKYNGKYGYYMESDPVSGEYWYKYKIKEIYGGFSIYAVNGKTYTLKNTYSYGSSVYNSFIVSGSTYLFRGTSYSSLDSVVGLDQLDAPEVVVADSTTPGTVKITWEAVTGATSYRVFRNGTYITTVSGNVNVDTFPDENKTYTYYVVAYDSTGNKKNSNASNTISVKSLEWPVTTVSRNGTKVIVKWEEISGASGYVVQRSTDGSSYKNIKTIEKGTTVSYSDASASLTKAYYYRVIPYYSCNGAKVYGTTNEKYVSKVVVTAPKSVSVSRSNTTKIKITWKKASGVSGYVIQRSTKKKTGYKTIKTITGNSKSSYSYTNKGVKAGTTYYYRVLSYKTVGSTKVYSSYSIKKVKKATVASLASGKVTVKRLSSKQVKISWKKVSDCTGYVIYRSTKKNSGYEKLATVTSKNTISYTDNTVKKGKAYYYKIRTYKKVGTGKIYGKYTSPKQVAAK